MKKHILMTASVLLLTLSSAFPSFAGVWKAGEGENAGRWWYDKGDGTWAFDGWQWLDRDGDGAYECCYFDPNGWLLTDTVTPDGYTVDANGAWTVDGIVQRNTAAGWQKLDYQWKYYTKGQYLTSQWRKISGKQYYFDADGFMAAGFQEIDGDLYYFEDSGALKTKSFTLDGVRYTVEDGVIVDEEDRGDWESRQSEKSGSSKKNSAKSTPDVSADDASGSPNGPSGEVDSSGSSYEKPDAPKRPNVTPDSNYRQSSVKDLDINSGE